GYLPDYRGVKSEFWALARHDLSRMGWTLHYMTAALDAGDIVLRRRVTWDGESPAAMRAKLLRDAAPAIAELLREVRTRGVTALPRTPQGAGAYYTTPRLVDWRLYRRRGAVPSLRAPP